jgi:hypothetical protein
MSSIYIDLTKTVTSMIQVRCLTQILDSFKIYLIRLLITVNIILIIHQTTKVRQYSPPRSPALTKLIMVRFKSSARSMSAARSQPRIIQVTPTSFTVVDNSVFWRNLFRPSRAVQKSPFYSYLYLYQFARRSDYLFKFVTTS